MAPLKSRAAPEHCPPADKQLDTAATVLRMLYIKDLRKLQTQIDEMIVQVQVSKSSRLNKQAATQSYWPTC